MNYETKIDIFNKLKERKRVQDLCDKLNKSLKSIIDINPEFHFWGSKEDGYYRIVNKNKYNEGIGLDLSIAIGYTDKMHFLNDKSIRNLEDDEIDKFIEIKYNKSNLLYVFIPWFSVEPKNCGIGSKVVYELIENLNMIDGLEKIILNPKNSIAECFWIKNGFEKEKKYDERVPHYHEGELTYNLKNEFLNMK